MAYNDKNPKLAVMIGSPGGPPDEEEHDEVEFEAPSGIDLEGKQPGDTLEAVCVLEIKEGGKLCVRKVNGVDVPGYEDKKPAEEEAPPDDKESFTSAAMGGDEAPAEGAKPEEEA